MQGLAGDDPRSDRGEDQGDGTDLVYGGDGNERVGSLPTGDPVSDSSVDLAQGHGDAGDDLPNGGGLLFGGSGNDSLNGNADGLRLSAAAAMMSSTRIRA